jgi:hypothetical protein
MTAVSKPMQLRPVVSILWVCCAAWMSAAPVGKDAEKPSPVAVNQLLVSGNACGPAALLNAFRFGNSDWQRALDAAAAENDKQSILRVIREIGMRPSKHIPGRPRWSRRGVSVADLRDMAEEMTMGRFLPRLSDEVFFLMPRETPEKLLLRVHQRLSKSISKGLPPVLSLRRYTLRAQPSGSPQWTLIDAHFVTLTAIHEKPARGARGFAIDYIDPWGGKYCQGFIRIPDTPVLSDASGNPSCLEADFPKTSVGLKMVRKGEKTFVAVSAAIGRW